MYKTYQGLYFDLPDSDDILFSEVKAIDSKIDITFKEFKSKVKFLAIALAKIGISKGDKVAIMSKSKINWLIFDFALQLRGAISVSIFYVINKNDFVFELKDSNFKYIYFNKKEKNLMSLCLKEGVQTIGNDNSFDYELSELYKIGKKYADYNFIEKIDSNDVFSIIYTNGTRVPKGVEITHTNIVHQMDAVSNTIILKKGDKAISMLPISFATERIMISIYISLGLNIKFINIDHKVSNLIKSIDPVIMTAIPKFFIKLYLNIKKEILFKSYLKRKIFGYYLIKCSQSILDKSSITYKVCNKLFFNDLKKIFGKDVKYIFNGGGLLPPGVFNFLFNCGIPIYQCYGMTEHTSIISTNYGIESKLGSVGKPLTGVRVKVDKDGELLVKSNAIMNSYHNNSLKTEKVLKDGWLKTGDIAEIDSEGFIFIKGRKKDILKNKDGKYIQPVQIEYRLCSNFLIDNAIAIAKDKPFVTVILFLSFNHMSEAKNLFKFYGSDSEFLNSKKLDSYISSIISKTNVRLNKDEKIKNFYVAKEPITVTDGGITPLLKIKREDIYKKYENEIEEMYKGKV